MTLPAETSHPFILEPHKKSATPNQKIFFQVQTRRLADPFESFNSSLAQ